MSAIAIVYALFGDRTAAEKAAVAMVEQRLAACANVLAPCLSVYHWEGRLEQAEESPVLFKTSLDRRDALIAALAAGHAYDVPAISGWSVTTTLDYAAWVEAETQPR
jgi:periplasmic divalent cation tolerance protein